MEISEKWTQEPPCFAITIWCAIKIAHQWMTARGGECMRNETMRKYISFFEIASIWCMPTLTVVYVAFYILGFVIYLCIEILSMDVFYILGWKWKIKECTTNQSSFSWRALLIFHLTFAFICMRSLRHSLSSLLCIKWPYIKYETDCGWIGWTHIKGNHSSRKHEIEHECSPKGSS